MNRNYILAPDGARVLGLHVLSCGEILDCNLMMERLGTLKEPVLLESVGKKPDGLWLNPFRALHGYLVSEMPEVETIHAYEVARYFGSKEHAEVKLRDQLSTLKQEMGFDYGFFFHVGMPLDEDLVYRNLGRSISATNWVDLGGEGIPFTHLGLVFRIPITKVQAEEILANQAEHKEFREFLFKHNGEVVTFPENYIAAARTLTKTATM